jgi:hypothetical protein
MWWHWYDILKNWGEGRTVLQRESYPTKALIPDENGKEALASVSPCLGQAMNTLMQGALVFLSINREPHPFSLCATLLRPVDVGFKFSLP